MLMNYTLKITFSVIKRVNNPRVLFVVGNSRAITETNFVSNLISNHMSTDNRYAVYFEGRLVARGAHNWNSVEYSV